MAEADCKTWNMEQRKNQVAELVKLFKENEKIYTTTGLNETECRETFINPFFKALKWDVTNEKKATPDMREVRLEFGVDVNGAHKRSDYAFCYGKVPKFFVEAKQPSVDLKTDPEPAIQVRNYAYSNKMPIAVLTDFEELAIYDARIKPKANDKADKALLKYLTYDQYVEHFDEIYETLSWDSVDTGHFEVYWGDAGNRKGSVSVDDDILSMVENWRTLLAEDIALHNKDIDEFNLTSCVQKIIDRIIFLRICEDKEIERFKTLKKIADSKTAVYDKLKLVFNVANKKFNAGLFATDKYLDSLAIEDKTLYSIINELYQPFCLYDFSVIPVEILGSIYERFLGKIIRFTRKTKNGHSVEIIEKPEVQKAGGVYYTPPYIVRYIVEQTIGKKIEGKNPEQVAQMRFVDPACGSGSFLVGAYQYLLDWHLNYYEKNPAKFEKAGKIYKDSITHDYKLSIEEKKEILLNNIYGVDIDAQAVEVTKLSLFIKLLENEGKALSSSGQVQLFRNSDIHEKILPSLTSNIKCGNSLVGSDYYLNKDLTLFGIKEQRKINAFDWEKEFVKIFDQGGFDCVIGNPPYVFARESNEKGMGTDEKEYYYSHYSVASYQINLYHLFVEKASIILKSDGLFSFIIPNNWLTINSNKNLRSFILQKSDLTIVNFKFKVFAGAEVDTSIIVFKNKKNNSNIKLYISEKPNNFSFIHECDTEVFLKEKDFVINIDSFTNSSNVPLLFKIEKDSCLLKELASVKAGLQAYEVGKGSPACTKKMKEDRVYHSTSKIDDTYFQYLQGVDVGRFLIQWSGEYLKYGKNLAAPRKFELFSTPRILVRQIPSKPPYCINASYIEDTILNDRNSMNIVQIRCNPRYLLTILNSRLISFWFEKKFGKLSRGLFPQFKINELEIFPIKNATPAQQEKLAKLADQMIEAKQKQSVVKSDKDKEELQKKISYIDQQINAAVYKLYGLTDDEIKMVEEN